MLTIEALAKTRAEWAAKLEHLQSMPVTTDRAERIAYEHALAEAEREYFNAERRFQNATSTLTTGELAALEKGAA